MLIAATSALLLAAGSLLATSPATAAGPTLRHACAAPGRWQCRAEVLVPATTASTGPRAATPVGYSATQLESIYNPSGLGPAGGTPTIAIIDAFDYPSAEADLAQYRSAMGLPPCTVASGCLSIVNQFLQSTNLPAPASPSDDWTVEDALDLDMASAICPDCKLMLVEATNDTGPGLIYGALTAASVHHYISMSWGGPDDGSIAPDEFTAPGAVFVAASGDNGYLSTADFPSTFSNVVAVGGVSLAAPGATPTAWSGAGSSCSTRVPQPTVQSTVTTGCAYKAASDLSALADPNTGVAIYDTYNNNAGWLQVGGTSASAPMVTALYALAGNHTDEWAPYENHSSYPALMQDVSSGSNGSCGAPLCDAGTGWDGPTGLGMPLTPEALALPLGDMTMDLTLEAQSQAPYDLTVALPTTVPDTAGTPQALASAAASVTGLPDGLTASVAGGSLEVSGTPTAPGTGTATVALSGTTPAGRTASGTAQVPWTVDPATLVPDGTVTIGGHVRHGRRVHAILPTVHTGTVGGDVADPTWKVTWLLNSRVAHTGRKYRLPRHSRGDRLRAKAHATLPGYTKLTVRSTVVRVR